MEKINKPVSGFAILVLCLAFLGLAAYFFINGSHQEEPATYSLIGGLCMLGFGILANVLVPKELKRLRQERSQAEVLWRAAQDAWVEQSGTKQFAEAKRETDTKR